MRPFWSLTSTITPDWWKATLQLDPDDPEKEQKVRMRIERQAEKELEAALKKQGNAVTRTAPTSAQDAIQRAQGAGTKVSDILRRMLQQSADLGVSVAVSQFDNIGFGFDWTLANQAAADWLRGYHFNLVSGIEDTTRKRLKTAVDTWLDNEEPLSELKNELAPIFGKQRAKMIATTETTRAYAEANRLAYKESGVVDKIELRTANDELVCPICGPRNNTVTDVDSPDFSGYGLPPLHVNCRCWIVPVVEDVPVDNG